MLRNEPETGKTSEGEGCVVGSDREGLGEAHSVASIQGAEGTGEL